MKNYTVNSVMTDLKGAISVRDKVIFVESQIGINGWGKVDFLKRLGYTVINKININA